MSATKKILATVIIAGSLFGGSSSASAADTKDAAIARAQAQAAFQSQMNTYVNAHRAIVDAHRAANAKALADFQAALATVTTDAELKAAKDARKAAVSAAGTTAKSAMSALVKPTKPAKPAPIDVSLRSLFEQFFSCFTHQFHGKSSKCPLSQATTKRTGTAKTFFFPGFDSVQGAQYRYANPGSWGHLVASLRLAHCGH